MFLLLQNRLEIFEPEMKHLRDLIRPRSFRRRWRWRLLGVLHKFQNFCFVSDGYVVLEFAVFEVFDCGITLDAKLLTGLFFFSRVDCGQYPGIALFLMKIGVESNLNYDLLKAYLQNCSRLFIIRLHAFTMPAPRRVKHDQSAVSPGQSFHKIFIS